LFTLGFIMHFSSEDEGSVSAQTWRSVGQGFSAMAQSLGPGFEVKGTGS